MTSPPVLLHRRLTTVSAALFGLSYICPTVVISTFGLLATTTHGATASAYVVATIAVLLTAVSYGRMAARYPQAGSAYTHGDLPVHGQGVRGRAAGNFVSRVGLGRRGLH